MNYLAAVAAALEGSSGQTFLPPLPRLSLSSRETKRRVSCLRREFPRFSAMFLVFLAREGGREQVGLIYERDEKANVPPPPKTGRKGITSHNGDSDGSVGGGGFGFG